MIATIKLITLTTANAVYHLTTYDRSITVQGVTYLAHICEPIIFQQKTAGLEADNFVITLISIQDHYDQALCEIKDYNLLLEQIDHSQIVTGVVTSYDISDNLVTLRIQTTKRLLTKHIARRYSPYCAAQWGDNRCGVNRENFKQTIRISAIQDQTVSFQLISGYGGIMNAPYMTDSLGNIFEISEYNAVLEKFSFSKVDILKINQIVYLYSGCEKTLLNCQNYNNKENYLGFIF